MNESMVNEHLVIARDSRYAELRHHAENLSLSARWWFYKEAWISYQEAFLEARGIQLKDEIKQEAISCYPDWSPSGVEARNISEYLNRYWRKP